MGDGDGLRGGLPGRHAGVFTGVAGASLGAMYFGYGATVETPLRVGIIGGGIAGLASADLLGEKDGEWRRVVIEKPFGHDLPSAKALNAEILKVLKEHRQNQAATLLFEPLLTTSDLVELLKVDRRTVTRLVKRGELPMPMKLGGSNRWRPEEISAAIDRLSRRIGRKIEPVVSDKE